MHFFEEEYQERFKDSESSTGINPEQLWADISSELDRNQDRRKVVWWWFLLVPFTIGLMISLYYYSEEASIKQEPQVTSRPLPLDASESASSMISPSGNASSEWMNEGVVPSTKEQGSVFEGREVVLSSVARSKESNQDDFKDSAIIEPTVTTITTKHSIQKEIDSSTDNQQIPTFSSLPNKTVNTAVADLDRKVAVVESLPSLIFTPEYANQVQSELPPLLPLKPSTKTTHAPTKLGIVTSTFTWKDRYQNENTSQSFAAELSAAQRSLGGYAVGLEVEYPIKKSWSLVTGLQLQKTYFTFEWGRNWDTIMYRNNIPGSDLINAKGIRQVKHQNELQALHLPILVGYEIGGDGNWRFGLRGGIGFNYLIGQKGKTLRDEITVVAFQQAASGPYNRFFISGQCSPYLAYQLSENTQFKLHGKFRYQWHGTSPIYNVAHSSLILGGGIGLTFAL